MIRWDQTTEPAVRLELILRQNKVMEVGLQLADTRDLWGAITSEFIE